MAKGRLEKQRDEQKKALKEKAKSKTGKPSKGRLEEQRERPSHNKISLSDRAVASQIKSVVAKLESEHLEESVHNKALDYLGKLLEAAKERGLHKLDKKDPRYVQLPGEQKKKESPPPAEPPADAGPQVLEPPK